LRLFSFGGYGLALAALAPMNATEKLKALSNAPHPIVFVSLDFIGSHYANAG